jgi:hypothetical protein
MPETEGHAQSSSQNGRLADPYLEKKACSTKIWISESLLCLPIGSTWMSQI